MHKLFQFEELYCIIIFFFIWIESTKKWLKQLKMSYIKGDLAKIHWL